MAFGMSDDCVIALFAIRVLDHGLELRIGIAEFFGLVIEQFLDFVIDEDVLDFLCAEEAFEGVPVLFGIEVGGVHAREADVILWGCGDIADIDIAAGLVREMWRELAAVLGGEVTDHEIGGFWIFGAIGGHRVHDEADGVRGAVASRGVAHGVAGARFELNATRKRAVVCKPSGDAGGAVKALHAKHKGLADFELVWIFLEELVVLLEVSDGDAGLS